MFSLLVIQFTFPQTTHKNSLSFTSSLTIIICCLFNILALGLLCFSMEGNFFKKHKAPLTASWTREEIAFRSGSSGSEITKDKPSFP